TTVADALVRALPDCAELLVCGGGRHNTALMARLSAEIACPVKATDAVGVDGDWVEALLMAWLARQRLAGLPANCPSVTGARAATPLGGLYLPPAPA
ncbi:MAG: anhydro-N-acetylmuramic acid kinase, partial [Pseudomonadota bacterium]